MRINKNMPPVSQAHHQHNLIDPNATPARHSPLSAIFFGVLEHSDNVNAPLFTISVFYIHTKYYIHNAHVPRCKRKKRSVLTCIAQPSKWFLMRSANCCRAEIIFPTHQTIDSIVSTIEKDTASKTGPILCILCECVRFHPYRDYC